MGRGHTLIMTRMALAEPNTVLTGGTSETSSARFRTSTVMFSEDSGLFRRSGCRELVAIVETRGGREGEVWYVGCERRTRIDGRPFCIRSWESRAGCAIDHLPRFFPQPISGLGFPEETSTSSTAVLAILSNASPQTYPARCATRGTSKHSPVSHPQYLSGMLFATSEEYYLNSRSGHSGMVVVGKRRLKWRPRSSNDYLYRWSGWLKGYF